VIVHRGDVEEKLTLAAGDVAVCVLEIVGDPEATGRGVAAIAASLPEKVAVLPLAESDCGEFLTSATRPADVVLMTASCRPAQGWLARLRAVAASDEMIGIVSPLGSELLGETGDLRPGAVVDTAERSSPRLRTCDPHCVYLRREALALIEVPSEANGDVIARLGDEVMAAGMLSLLADDLLVPLEPPAGRQPAPADVAFDEGSPAQQAVRLARIAQRTLSVTIDGRALNRIGGGTQRYVLELVLALERVGAGAVSLRVVLPPDPPAAVLAELALRPGIETIRYEQALGGVARTDVVHRPQQVFSVDDLNLVRLLGDRLVITHQDLIGYHNAAYHSRPEHWERYRHATRLALAAADRTVFFSEAARHDAIAEGLGDVERTDVIGIALDEPFPESARAPAEMTSEDEFIVCLGADYRHKNRPFALRVFAALREHHGFRGRLLLAGAHVEHGSSADLERAVLHEQPDLAASVTDLGGVAEPSGGRRRGGTVPLCRTLLAPRGRLRGTRHPGVLGSGGKCRRSRRASERRARPGGPRAPAAR
jgi:hypothetical protein